jgi:hypothetical protein
VRYALYPVFTIGRDLHRQVKAKNKKKMFWVIFVILLVLWALGLICHIAFSHILLVIALIVLVIRLVRGRTP